MARLLPSVKERIYKMHVDHPEMTLTAIAKRYHINISYVHRIIKEYTK